MKTITELNTRPWFRFLKVLYVLVLLLTAFFVYLSYNPTYDTFPDNIIVPFIVVLAILELFKRFVYYITLGTVRPLQHEMKSLIESIAKRLSLMNEEKVPKKSLEMFQIITYYTETLIKNYDDTKIVEYQNKIRLLDDMIYNFYCVYQEQFSTHHADVRIRAIRFLYLADKVGVSVEKLNWSIDL